jgi:PAS domain S-box-containing protein
MNILENFQTITVPHGICLSWNKYLIALHEFPDLVIAIFYFAIPWVGYKILGKKIADAKLRSIAILFSLFILFCGLTHLIDALTIWTPMYWTLGIVKLITMTITVLTFIKFYPYILKLSVQPNKMEYSELNNKLVDSQSQIVILKTENERLEKCIENINEVVLIINKEFEVLFVNKKFTDFVGYTIDEIKNKSLDTIADGLMTFEDFKNLTIGNNSQKWTGFITVKTKHIETIELPASIIPMQNQYNRIYNYMITLYPI